ncbi:MAG: DNA adenine methylase [Firmicutes bacterium]|nr:DNA adenine methylase [Bacillota bacterium]
MAFLKYPGGKERELPQIIAALPPVIKDYYEPFVGGGSVYLAVKADNYYINDRSDELIDLYRRIQSQDEGLFGALSAIDRIWTDITVIADEHAAELLKIYKGFRNSPEDNSSLTSAVKCLTVLCRDELTGIGEPPFDKCRADFFAILGKTASGKLARMKKLEKSKGLLPDGDVLKNLEGAVKAAFYTYCREMMNIRRACGGMDVFDAALYLFIRETCYSSMFRYNEKGGFNVPYGGISYNRKTLAPRIAAYKDPAVVAKLRKTDIFCMDFEDFLNAQSPQKGDFVFLDPPYDTDFSQYAGNSFGQVDQKRLADWLIKSCEANFMVVIKNTEFIDSIYPDGVLCRSGGRLRKTGFDKTYQVSFMNRNDRKAEHLIITNY